MESTRIFSTSGESRFGRNDGENERILLVIDMQKGLTGRDLYSYDTFMDRTPRVVDTARKGGVELIFFQHDTGPDCCMTAGTTVRY